MSEQAVAEMLTEQDIDLEAQAVLNALAFVTPADLVGEAVASVEEAGGEDWRFDRLVASLVADAGRAAESVAITARPGVGWVRYLRPPSCSRCAVLAGRFYRWSDGFRRHPGCDCVHLASTEAAAEGLVTDPVELVEQGLVSGLSKADRRAILDGADVSQVVNTRTAMTASAPASRLRPMSIYDAATDQADAIRLLRLYGYIT